VCAAQVVGALNLAAGLREPHLAGSPEAPAFRLTTPSASASTSRRNWPGALDRGLSAGRPVVIDVHTDIDVIAPVPVV
jgi:hypothetical protein